MKITSSAFGEGGAIPRQYTCDGENINPPLSISGIPENAVSLVLIVDDVDAPGGVFDHWIVFDIPAAISEIRSGEAPGVEGINSFGNVSYGGPCPHQGEHRYYFRIFALNILLKLPRGSDRAKVAMAMKGHILDDGGLMGRYSR